MPDRYDSLAPDNVIVTLRSLKRRFSEASGAILSDPDLLARVNEAGPEGRSFAAVIQSAAVQLEGLAGEQKKLISSDGARVSNSSIHPDPDSTARRTIDANIQVIAAEAESLADQLDGVEPDDWTRSAPIDTGGDIDLITLARQTVRATIEELREAERLRDWLCY